MREVVSRYRFRMVFRFRVALRSSDPASGRPNPQVPNNFDRILDHLALYPGSGPFFKNCLFLETLSTVETKRNVRIPYDLPSVQMRADTRISRPFQILRNSRHAWHSRHGSLWPSARWNETRVTISLRQDSVRNGIAMRRSLLLCC